MYEKGLVFLNRRIPLAEAEDDGTIGKDILQKTFTVSVHTGQMHTNKVFSENEDNSVITTKTLPIKFKDIDYHVVRAAMNSFTSFSFDQLKKLYPQLKSGKEFITSENYLANLDIRINGIKSSVSEYSQSDKLMIAKSVLKEIEPLLLMRGKTYRGTKEFKPFQIKDKFRDVIRLNVTIPPGNQEFGIAMSDPRTKYPLKLSAVDWYAYNENYGTSEEKALVKYIEGIMPKLEEKYDEIYLVRNEKDIKIYSFDTGQAFEPDFILFLRIKGTSDKYDNLQLFIEPKGDGLLKQDKWKNDFLKQIKQTAEIHYCTSVDNYIVWGIPFFNESNNKEFEASFNDDVLKYSAHPNKEQQSVSSIIIDNEMPKEKSYDFIPEDSDIWMAAESFESYKWNRLDQSICDFFGGDKTILVGCYKGKKHLDWIQSHQMYTIRLGKVKGSMEDNRMLFEKTSVLVLYELGKPNKLSAYKVIAHQEMAKEELVAMNYPNTNPRKNYMTFSFTSLDMDLNSLAENHLIEKLIELSPSVIKGTPVFIEP